MKEQDPIQIQPFGLANVVDDDTEFIPLLSIEDEEHMNAQDVPETLAILPLRNTVLFPGGVLPLKVFETRYVDMVRDCMKHEMPFGIVQITWRKAGIDAIQNEAIVEVHIGIQIFGRKRRSDRINVSAKFTNDGERNSHRRQGPSFQRFRSRHRAAFVASLRTVQGLLQRNQP